MQNWSKTWNKTNMSICTSSNISQLLLLLPPLCTNVNAFPGFWLPWYIPPASQPFGKILKVEYKEESLAPKSSLGSSGMDPICRRGVVVKLLL